MRSPRRGPFDAAPLGQIARAVPSLIVIVGSLITILPFVAIVPILPPFGLLMLLGWRLLRTDAFPIWAALPLGLFDDLLSGQPLGSAMLLWSLSFFVIDVINQRLVYRDFWQDWLIAAGAIALCLLMGRAFAAPIGAHVDTSVLLQIVISILLFPLMSWACAWLDAKRGSE